MARNWRRTGGAAANGFAPRTLLQAESEALRENGYPVPPDMRIGAGSPSVSAASRCRGRLSGGTRTSTRRRSPTTGMSSRRRSAPTRAGTRKTRATTPATSRHSNSPGAAPRDKNILGREAFSSPPGRTLATVMEHIAGGGSILEWPAYVPPPQPPPATRWAPRAPRLLASASRATASSCRVSSSRSTASGSRTHAAGLLTPKPEPMKVKAESGTTHTASLYEELAAASQAYDEEELLRQAQAASLHDVPPMDAPNVYAWSARMHAIKTGVPFLDLTGDDARALAA